AECGELAITIGALGTATADTIASPMPAARSCVRREAAIMKSPICDMLGIAFPLLAFSHCRDVVAAVSRAGGFGVLGATAHSPQSIEQELKWIDGHSDGKPYGL